MKNIHRLKALFLVLALGAASCLVGAAVQPPDSEYNEVLQQIETVDSVLVGESFEVRHSIDAGPGAPKESKLLSDHPANDTSVRLAVDPDGHSWVAWTRETEISQVLIRKRNAGGAWTNTQLVSEEGENSASPELLHDGHSIHVTYTIDDGEGIGIAVRSGDGPVPWPMRSVIHTIYSREIQPEPALHLINRELVVVWNESPFALGYSIYDRESASWGVPQTESHEGDPERALDKLERELN